MNRRRLQEILGFQFKNPELLELALTHRSAAGNNNERLEFLGDSVLNMVISGALFDRFPKAVEGELSRLRARLVRKETLAELARELDLGDLIRLGSGELKSGGFRRDSILADGLEAIFGAIYKDSGMEASSASILGLYHKKLESVDLSEPLKDPKTRLQEVLQARALAIPKYSVIAITGETHDQEFSVECRVEALNITTIGKGTSRRRAEQQAAELALGTLTHE